MERIWSVSHLSNKHQVPHYDEQNDVKQPLVNDYLPNDHEIYQEYF